MASEACKTTLKFLEKIPVYVTAICRNVVSDDYFSLLNINVVCDECIINSSLS